MIFNGRSTQDRLRYPKVLDIAFAEAKMLSLELDPSTAAVHSEGLLAKCKQSNILYKDALEYSLSHRLPSFSFEVLQWQLSIHSNFLFVNADHPLATVIQTGPYRLCRRPPFSVLV